ncbi:hypothetical protein E4H12_01840 [Candidatus Thorarchaeota archaeon]|nr:MAG: hypothetical protein E4H12_01840 [Candidatus Thorarchaeota archaeon]
MKNWNVWLGVVLVIIGIVVAAYVGIWWSLIGGIILFIEGVKADPVNSAWIAYGLVRIIFTSLITYITAVVIILPAIALITYEPLTKKKLW